MDIAEVKSSCEKLRIYGTEEGKRKKKECGPRSFIHPIQERVYSFIDAG